MTSPPRGRHTWPSTRPFRCRLAPAVPARHPRRTGTRRRRGRRHPRRQPRRTRLRGRRASTPRRCSARRRRRAGRVCAVPDPLDSRWVRCGGRRRVRARLVGYRAAMEADPCAPRPPVQHSADAEIGYPAANIYERMRAIESIGRVHNPAAGYLQVRARVPVDARAAPPPPRRRSTVRPPTVCSTVASWSTGSRRSATATASIRQQSTSRCVRASARAMRGTLVRPRTLPAHCRAAPRPAPAGRLSGPLPAARRGAPPASAARRAREHHDRWCVGGHGARSRPARARARAPRGAPHDHDPVRLAAAPSSAIPLQLSTRRRRSACPLRSG